MRYDKFAIDWFINIQKIWRKDLLEKKLLTDKDFDHVELKKIKLPQFKEKYNKNFFELIKKLNITEGILPNDNDVEIWYDIMEKDPLKEVYEKTENTWGFNYLFTEEDLYKKIDSFHSIFDFQQKFNEDTASVLDWFNDLYHFLSDNNCKDCLNKYKMIPNQNGIFKKSEEINGNDIADMIPKIINPIYLELFGKEINDIIVMEEINLSYLGESVKKKNFQDILNEFSNFLKENNDEKKKEYLCKELISFSLNDRLINQMFEFQKQSDEGFRNKQRKELNNYHPKHNIWREVQDYWFDSHSKTIESKENINNLKEILSRENQTSPLTWINNYIKFLKYNSTIVEKKKYSLIK